MDLLERLEKATGPERTLDHAIARAFGWQEQLGGWLAPGSKDYEFENVPLFTASLDASIALVERVLPGWAREVSYWPKHTHKVSGHEWNQAQCSVTLTECGPNGWHDSRHRRIVGEAPTESLALLTALLRALKETRE